MRILINFEGLKWNIEFSLSSEQDIENHRFCSETGYRFQDLGLTAPPITLPNTNAPPPPPSGRDTGLIVCLFLCGFPGRVWYVFMLPVCCCVMQFCAAYKASCNTQLMVWFRWVDTACFSKMDTILKEFAFKTPLPSSRKRLIFHKVVLWRKSHLSHLSQFKT